MLTPAAAAAAAAAAAKDGPRGSLHGFKLRPKPQTLTLNPNAES